MELQITITQARRLGSLFECTPYL